MGETHSPSPPTSTSIRTMTKNMIGFEGTDLSGLRLRPVVIANHSKLQHYYNLIKSTAKDYLLKQALYTTDSGDIVVEPSLFFTQDNKEINNAVKVILEISGLGEEDWEHVLSPNDLVQIFLGTDKEPSIIEQLNYPTRAAQTREVLEQGLSEEMRALITCLFLTEHGDFSKAKEMIECLTPEQLEVLVATKALITKRSGGDVVKTHKQLAAMAGVSEETAEKVFALIN